MYVYIFHLSYKSYILSYKSYKFFKEHNLLKNQEIYYIAVLKFYFKLVNNHLPHYFNNFTPQFSAGHQHYNFRNPTRLLPKK